MDESWTLRELVNEVATRIAALPEPTNGQVRAVPDDRTIRYYGTIGLVDRPAAMRGRTALYGRRHLAQVVAIKRLQTMGRSLAEIQAMWPTLDDATLARMTGVAIAPKGRASRREFWKRAPAAEPPVAAGAPEGPPPRRGAATAATDATPVVAAAELRIELGENVAITIAMSDDLAISLADVAAIRAAAAPLIAELARRQLAVHAEPGEES